MSKTRYAGFVALLLGLTLPMGMGTAQAADEQGSAGEKTLEIGHTGDSTDQSAAAEKSDEKSSKKKSKDKKKKSDGPKPGQTRKADVVKHGWWWTANEPPPDSGLLAAPQPPTPTTPKGTLAVGAVGGDPERVAAIEVRLEAETGSLVRSFQMVLRESAEPGANLNAETATILACPVTEVFWADGDGAAWKNRPAYDCDLGSVRGKRDDQGLWRFDLTTMASAWLTEGNTSSRSVVLVEGVDAPESFQVSLDGAKAEGIGLELKAIAPAPIPGVNGAGSEGTSGSSGSGVSGSSGSSSGGSSSGGSFGGGGGGGEPALIDGGSPKAGDSAPVASGGSQGEQGQVALEPAAFTPAWYSGLPRGGLLLVPFALVLAYLIMIALGPDGRPLPATGRHGVSRALDRLRQVRTTGVGR